MERFVNVEKEMMPDWLNRKHEMLDEISKLIRMDDVEWSKERSKRFYYLFKLWRDWEAGLPYSFAGGLDQDLRARALQLRADMKTRLRDQDLTVSSEGVLHDGLVFLEDALAATRRPNLWPTIHHMMYGQLRYEGEQRRWSSSHDDVTKFCDEAEDYMKNISSPYHDVAWLLDDDDDDEDDEWCGDMIYEQ
jgi:hypothetical protein